MVEGILPKVEFRHPFRRNGIKYADGGDIDGMLELLQVIKDEQQELKALEYAIRGHLATVCEFADKKTAHLKGDRFTAEVKKPSTYFNQATLKELVKDDGELSRTYLRIATYAVNMKDFNMLARTNGNERFEAYKRKLVAAQQESSSPATVTVKEA